MLTCVTTQYLCFCVFDIRDNNSRFLQDLLLYNWTKICRLFHILTQFPISRSEAELYYYHQKVNVRVASRVAERHKA